jgi:hypothetical protein
MRLSLSVAVVGAATTVTAAVNIGTILGQHVAWWQDHDPCIYTVIGKVSDGNPCEKRFKIEGHEYYVSYFPPCIGKSFEFSPRALPCPLSYRQFGGASTSHTVAVLWLAH